MLQGSIGLSTYYLPISLYKIIKEQTTIDLNRLLQITNSAKQTSREEA